MKIKNTIKNWLIIGFVILIVVSFIRVATMDEEKHKITKNEGSSVLLVEVKKIL